MSRKRFVAQLALPLSVDALCALLRILENEHPEGTPLMARGLDRDGVAHLFLYEELDPEEK